MPATAPNAKKVRSSIARERAKSEALFLCISDGVIATDEDGKIERINKKALELLGFPAKDLLGAWYPSAIVAKDPKGKTISTISRPICQALLTGKTVSCKLLYKKRDRSLLPVSVTSSPILMGDKPIGAVELFRAIPEKSIRVKAKPKAVK